MFCPALLSIFGTSFPAVIPTPDYLDACAIICKPLFCKLCYCPSICWYLAEQKAAWHGVNCGHTCVTLKSYCHKIINRERSQNMPKISHCHTPVLLLEPLNGCSFTFLSICPRCHTLTCSVTDTVNENPSTFPFHGVPGAPGWQHSLAKPGKKRAIALSLQTFGDTKSKL